MVIWRYAVLERGSPDDERLEPGADWRPDLDVYEDPFGFMVALAVPAVRREDIEVTAVGTLVTIRGTRTLPVPTNATTHRIEMARGRFERRVRLPATADPSRARTALEDGLLLVRVPKVGTPGSARRPAREEA